MAKRLLSVERIVALSSDPAGAEGGLYYNSVSKVLRYHNGTSWTTLSGGSSGTGQFTGDTAPVSPVLSDIWFDTSTGKTYVYYDSFWVEVGTSEGGRPLTLSGDVTGTGTDSIATTLGPSGVGAGTYGSTSAIPVLTIDVKGRVTAAGTAAISTTLTGLADVNAGVLADNDVLSYNFATSKWVNQNLASAIAEVDGPTSGIDADLLDGQHGSYYTTAGNLTGTIPSAVLGTSSIFIGTTSIALNRGTGALTLAGITLSSPTFTGTITTPLTTAGYVTTTSGGVLGSVATIPNVGLTNSTVTVGTTSIALGASSTTLAGLTSVAATTFTGALSGNATSATNATNTGITEDTATAVSVYPTWVTANTGNLPQKTTSTRLSFVPSTGVLTATQFSGSGAGLTAVPAGQLSGTIPSAVLGNSTVFIGTTGVALNRGTGALTLAGITLSAPTFTGTMTTSLTTAGYVTTTVGGVLGSVATIPNAGLTNSSVTIGSTAVALGATVTTFAGLTSVTSTTFVGALTGNASSATNATNTAITDDTTTAATMYPTWVTAATGNLPQKTTSTKLTFNPSTGTLAATVFSGSGASLTNIPNGALTNSSVTVNGTAIALGASGTVTAAAGTLTGTTLNATVTGSSLTSVGTITTGTWNATDIALGAGGTNASLTAVNGGVVYSTASAMAITAAGNSGEFLKSNGAGAPTWAAVVGGASYQTTAPATPSVGQLWVDSDEVFSGLNSNDFLLKSGGTMTGNLVVGGNLSVTGTFSGEEFMVMAISDETTALTTGTAKLTWRAPYAMTLTQIPRASLSTASTSGLVTVDMNEAGTSVLGANKLSIDANEKTSTTAATATTLADTSIANDAEITFDIDAAGTGAKGLKVIVYYKRT
jgi:hypothetical protein